MKKNLLLATSAMVATGFFATQAAAQIEVTLGGQIEFQAGYAFSEDTSATGGAGMGGAQALGGGVINNDPNDANFGNVVSADDINNGVYNPIGNNLGVAANRSGDFTTITDNIAIGISNTADNGLTYGGQYRVDTGRVRLYVSGAFGRVRMGQWDTAAHELRVRVPFAGTDRFGGDAEDYVFNAGIVGDGLNDTGGALISYTTTGTALDDTGLTLGLSYTPSTTAANGIDRTESAGGEYNDVGSVAFNYDNEFSGVGVRFGAGYSFGSAGGTATVGDAGGANYFVDNNGNNDVYSNRNLSAWNVGAGLAVAGFDVGAQYIDRSESGNISGFNDETWLVGTSYTVGPWVFGVSYADASQDVSVSGVDAGNATRAGYSVDEQRFGLGTAYSVAPGLDVKGDLAYIDSQWSTSGDNAYGENVSIENDAWVGVVTTALSF
ncbi:porin [Fodinicurvata sp. EGI_FJ10296]|uniref:porin n=1 Tax=Fodinicurvata sp. EGI_FJ10296 TaxID=3231908 RepID=UPI0034520D8B